MATTRSAQKPPTRKANSSVPSKLKEAPKSDSPEQTPDCPVVGIGASAGGFEALTELLHALPADTGMAFVFIQHLDPKHESLLTELLARETRMPVIEIQDGMRVQPNRLHVIPRNASLSIRDGVLALIPRGHARASYMPVDQFLRSLSEDQQSLAIGVILSGTASDGALGLKAVKAQGGITFAQEEGTAKFDGMPRSAIAAGGVDFVLPPSGIAKELERISRHPYVRHGRSLIESGLQDSADSLNRILTALRHATGVDFTYYKATTVRRRILRRMHLRRMETLDDYAGLLKDNPEEVRRLFDEILINVTEFFRDPETFEMLKEKVFPKITAERGNSPVRVWVPGCSSGEEVYSIAISLLEYLELHRDETPLQIFGTDISEHALDRARSGIYPASIAHDVSPERLRRYFTKVEDGYQILKRIREMCIFARQNLAKDPPFSRLDLISCRNVLIYLGPVLQKKAIPVFHYALSPGRFLLLGPSETIGLFSELFIAVDKKHKLYTRRQVPGRVPLEFSVPDLRVEPRESTRAVEAFPDPPVQREADRVVLNKYGPPGVIIDGHFNIIHFRGQTGAYLQPPSGAATLNLLKMAREGLMAELRNAIQRCRREGVTVRREGLRIRTEAGVHEFSLEVTPLHPKSTSKNNHLLVLFDSGPPAAQAGARSGAGRKSNKRDSKRDREVEQVRTDLATTREYLQSIIEEQEATNEELRSANEEIQSSNEELQSTNEEMETAKEELQSANEELNTVNEELQNRNLQLDQISNDLINLLSNVSIPIVMLGTNLHIRRFTPISEKVLNLSATDIGRSVTDIKFPMEIPQLEQLILEVIDHLAPKSIETRDSAGHAFSLRIRPYRTEENKIEGVVLVFVDLDPPRQADGETELASAARAALLLGGSDKLLHHHDQLQALAGQLITVQEEEGRRIARDLHDDLGQRLAAVERGLREFDTDGARGRHRERLRGLLHDLSQAIEDLSNVASQLHPSKLEDLGLPAALRSLVQEFQRHHRIHVRFAAQQVPADLAPSVKLALYRITQEALRNAAKHSSASKASVSLTATSTALRLSIRDCGRGMSVKNDGQRRGLGITSMEERARLVNASLSIKSDRNGTEVDVHVPLTDQARGKLRKG